MLEGTGNTITISLLVAVHNSFYIKLLPGYLSILLAADITYLAHMACGRANVDSHHLQNVCI